MWDLSSSPAGTLRDEAREKVVSFDVVDEPLATARGGAVAGAAAPGTGTERSLRQCSTYGSSARDMTIASTVDP